MYAKPSNGSLICTFADCPYRDENIHDEPACGEQFNNYCPLGARRKDFSECLHSKAKVGTSHWNQEFCEVATREGICPCGFTR